MHRGRTPGCRERLRAAREDERRRTLVVGTDDRLIEAENSFQGERVADRGLSLARPGYWWRYRNPMTPSWGEPYAAQHARVLGAVRDAAARVPGREAVLVSHQLPIWTVRRWVEGRKLWHRPDWRQCGLASLTSLTWEDDRLLHVTYSEPAGAVSRRPGFGA